MYICSVWGDAIPDSTVRRGLSGSAGWVEHSGDKSPSSVRQQSKPHMTILKNGLDILIIQNVKKKRSNPLDENVMFLINLFDE